MIGFYNYTVWLTYLSLLSGTAGILLCVYDPKNVLYGVLCLMFSGICDMFDGKVARTKKDRTRKEKDFGIEIDSLTDLVCFGVLPVVILISLLSLISKFKKLAFIFILVGLMYVLFGMIRLAYFNVLEIERQRVESKDTNDYYYGCPITFSSFTLPLAYFIGLLFTPIGQLVIFSSVMFMQGICFIIKIKVKKIKI